MPLVQPTDGFAVVTMACETHITVEITELVNTAEMLPSDKARRCEKFLELFSNLQNHIVSLDMENRLGVPLYYVIPSEYYNMFE